MAVRIAIDEIDLKIREKEFATILVPQVVESRPSFALCRTDQADPRSVRLDRNVMSGPGRTGGWSFEALHALSPWLTVKESWTFGLEFSGMPKDKTGGDRSGVCGEGRLEGFEQDLPERVFRRDERRVAVARALANNPPISSFG